MQTTTYNIQGGSSSEEGPKHSGEQRRGRCFQEANPVLAHLPEILQRFTLFLGQRLNYFSSYQGPHGPVPANLSSLGPSSPCGPDTLGFFLFPKQATIVGQLYNLSFKPGHFGGRKMVLLINDPGQVGLSGTDTDMWSLYSVDPATGPLHKEQCCSPYSLLTQLTCSDASESLPQGSP